MKEEEELQQVEEPFTFFCGCIPSVTMHILAKQERERDFNAGMVDFLFIFNLLLSLYGDV